MTRELPKKVKFQKCTSETFTTCENRSELLDHWTREESQNLFSVMAGLEDL